MNRLFIALCLAAILVLSACSAGNLDYVKERSEARWREVGWEPLAYEGYSWGLWGIFGSNHGGAHVWYRVNHIPDNGITYSGYIIRWGEELHVYGPFALDAIRPNAGVD